MTPVLLFAAALAAAPPAAGAHLDGNRNVATLVNVEDYPAEALRKREQGTVAIRLDIDAAGRLTACTVTQSSKSASLDAATCRIMTERARFVPARDDRGRAVPDTMTTRVMWRIAPDLDSATEAAVIAWANCMADAARPLLPGTPSNEAVADKVIGSCPSEEEAVLAAVAKQPPGSGPANPAEARAGIRSLLVEAIAAARSRARP